MATLQPDCIRRGAACAAGHRHCAGRGATLTLTLTLMLMLTLNVPTTQSVPKCSLPKYGFRASGVLTTASANRAETGLLPKF